MSQNKELNLLVGNIMDEVAQTQTNVQFLSNIINSYLDNSINATPVDMYGFSQLCQSVEKGLNECMEGLDDIHSLNSKRD